jgi:hypothetical protein
MNSKISVETIEYKGWKNCVRLSNDKIEVVVTTDVGPRIIHCAFPGGENVFKNYPEMMGKTGGDEWRIYGGHRLWHAPENDPRTYYPDNTPVQWEEIDGGAKFIQPTETTTGIQKEIEVRLPDDTARVEVLHRLINHNLWAVGLAPWALSVMDVGGIAIIPLPPRGTHPEELLPTSSITIWPFTHMNDPRWTWGEKYILLRQDENASTPQKTGVQVRDGWAAYANKNQLFVKTFSYTPGATYPDFNATVETFTNHEMLELETLGPTTRLEPNAAVEHRETWHLFSGVSTPMNETDVEANVLPKVREVLS